MDKISEDVANAIRCNIFGEKKPRLRRVSRTVLSVVCDVNTGEFFNVIKK